MSARRRSQAFAAFILVCVAVAATAIGLAARDSVPTSGAPVVPAAARDVLVRAQADERSVLLFRSLDRRQPKTYGQVAVTSLDDPSKPRRLVPLRCDRVHFQAGRGVCIARGSSFAAGFKVKLFGERFRVQREFAVKGVPSRARVSPDGRYGSVTLFVGGHSYAVAGMFSTQTTLIDLERNMRIGDLESFSVSHRGRRVTARDRNFWGVTFAPDSDTFYATMATGDKTYLVRGSVSKRRAQTIHENIECPSLSPDGTRIGYKKRVGTGTKLWRLHVLDLATMRETQLAEERVIDDQVEWLDGGRLLYRVDEEVWAVAANGSGRPRRFAASGDSPGVVRARTPPNG